jgi:hypothetical protein
MGGVMLVVLIISAMAGILLGLYFKLLALVPAMSLATVVITANGFTNDLGPGMIALIVIGSGASLQVGYLVGCVLHTVASADLPAPKTARQFTGSEPA